MLNTVQDFIIVFIEISTILIVWSNFDLKIKNSVIKNLIIILISSFILIITPYTPIHYNTFFSYLSVIILVKFIYNKPLIKTIVEFFIFIFFISILELIAIMSMNFIGSEYSSNFKSNISIAVSILFFTILICNFIPKKAIYHISKLNFNILYYFIINLGVYILISKLIWEYDNSLILDNLAIFIIILSIMFLLNLSLYCYITKITEEKKILEIQKQYNPILMDIIEEVRRRQHEFKNYLNTINGIIEVSNEKELRYELKNYMKSLNFSTKSLEDIVYIDNIIIKSVVYNKLCESERLNIKFLYDVSNDLLEDKLNDYEISDILNNLLNNAFEAVQVRNKNDRVVILNIFTEGDKNVLEVKNSGITINKKNIENIFKLGFSTKEGKNRGYGLYNIKKIVERNGGNVQLYFDDNYTVFRLLFKQTFRGIRFSNKYKTS